MTTQLVPIPLMCTNVTKDDHIWKQESPDSDKDRGFPRLCSPPLKHITPQTTQDLLENFDPFDVLDSASERSTSSADTMIMMTSEEEGKNAQRIRNSLRHYESNKSLLRSPSASPLPLHQYSRAPSSQSSYSRNSCDLEIPTGKEDFPKRRNVPNNLLVSCQPRLTDTEKQFTCEKPSPLDDGYGTDSRSNTSASTSSPLSSSFSSLSTFEGSLGSNSSTGISGIPSPNTPTSPNANMSRHAIIKGQPLPSSLRNSGGQRPVLLPAKKRETTATEIKDNSPNLEDRLRALTTIEEEDVGGVVHDKYLSEKRGPSKTVQTVLPRSQNRVRFDIAAAQNQQSANNDFKLSELESFNSSGFFRAEPIEIVASPSLGNKDMVGNKDGTNSLPRGGHQTHSDASSASNSFPSPSHERRDGWGDYTKFFEKNSDIPLHNITSAGRGKFLNAGTSDHMHDKDINRKIGTRSATPSKRPGHEHNQDIRYGMSELSHNSHGPSPSQSLSGNFRPSEINRMQFDQSVRPLPLDQSSGHSHWPKENRPSSLPISSNLNAHSMTQVSLYDQGPQSLPPHNQLFNQAQNSNQYFYQDQPSFEHSESEKHRHDFPLSSAERTSHDEFLSLSRSLSKQNMQLREMLQHEQQPQLQRYHQPLKSYHDRSPSIYQPSPQNEFMPPYSQNSSDVVMRNSYLSSSMRSLSNRHDRYSWHRSNTSTHPKDWIDANMVAESAPNHRVSLDLGSIPQLQRQIRATSEMCLQMSKKHVFASSADIYKLFQGQRKPDNRHSASATNGAQFGVSSGNNSSNSSNGNGRDQFHRHSFHSTSARPLWASSQPELESQNSQMDSLKASLTSLGPSLRVPSPALSTSSRLSNPGPIRVDHSITIPSNLRPGAGPEMSNHSADVIDGHKFQRQSSGYSSENELQQIESNAKASRKVRVRDPRATLAINPEQEFRPVNPSSDRGSSTTAVDDESSSMTDNEPVYVNQRMLANAGVLESLENPPSSAQRIISSSVSPLPPRSHAIHSVSSTSPRPTSGSHGTQQHLNSPRQNSHQQLQQQPGYTQIHHQSEAVRRYLSEGNPNAEESVRNRPTPTKGLTQRQVINFNSKPVTITSIVPASSYSPVNTREENEVKNAPAQNVHHNDNANKLNRRNNEPLSISITQADDLSRDTTNESSMSHHLGESSHPYRHGSSSSLQLSPVEIAQMLDVPFATNIISDENGDRLSTLV